MRKPIRRLATVGAPAMVAAGTLLAAGGPATAATEHPSSHASAESRVVVRHQPSRHPASHRHMDPWIAGQLAWFDPAAAHRIAIYDPWIKDQLAQFTGGGS
ncbi:hypothetical protein [Streptomyces mexicanus]|uniref:hypothetical protein n=1 Tax=Streptomyces mexicanus TaxID=178566 RepID=UPI0031F0997E